MGEFWVIFFAYRGALPEALDLLSFGLFIMWDVRTVVIVV